MKTSGFEIGHDAEVTQGAKPSGQTLSELEQTVNRLDGAIGKSSFQEGDNAAPMFLNALCQLAKRFEPTELCPLAPPAQGLLILVGEDILEHVAQVASGLEAVTGGGCYRENDCKAAAPQRCIHDVCLYRGRNHSGPHLSGNTSSRANSRRAQCLPDGIEVIKHGHLSELTPEVLGRTKPHWHLVRQGWEEK